MQPLTTSIDANRSTRDKVLFTAHDLFYNAGVRATGIDRLIADAKVTKTTFCRHFPSKKNLILEFLELRHQNWLKWFNSRVDYYGNTPSAISRAIGVAIDGAILRAQFNQTAEQATEALEYLIKQLDHPLEH